MSPLSVLRCGGGSRGAAAARSRGGEEGLGTDLSALLTKGILKGLNFD